MLFSSFDWLSQACKLLSFTSIKNEDEIKQNLTFYLVVNKYNNAMNFYFSCIPLNMQSNPTFTLQSMTCILHAF